MGTTLAHRDIYKERPYERQIYIYEISSNKKNIFHIIYLSNKKGKKKEQLG